MKTEISEQDWERVNAYSDGEMAPRDRQAFETRLKSEPDLAAALACVREVSRSLAALHPESAAPASRRTRHTSSLWQSSRWKWGAGGVLAASIAGFAYLALPSSPSGAMKIHAEFLDQTFALGTSGAHTTVALRGLPDLSAANLTFVASRETGIGTAAHYSGQRGCRLTFFALSGPIELPADGQMEGHQWNFGERYFAVLAVGMDREKFAAIAGYLEEETRRQTRPSTVLALREATQKASRCT